jgi:hypothetical protein
MSTGVDLDTFVGRPSALTDTRPIAEWVLANEDVCH